MEIITEDRWTEEVWGAATAPGTNRQDTANSNLVFYWGQGVSCTSEHLLLMIADDSQGPMGC